MEGSGPLRLALCVALPHGPNYAQLLRAGHVSKMCPHSWQAQQRLQSKLLFTSHMSFLLFSPHAQSQNRSLLSMFCFRIDLLEIGLELDPGFSGYSPGLAFPRPLCLQEATLSAHLL